MKANQVVKKAQEKVYLVVEMSIQLNMARIVAKLVWQGR